MQCVEKREILSLEKFSLNQFFSKTIAFSFEKYLRKKCETISAISTLCEHNVRQAQCGNYGNLLSYFFGKKFVKTTYLVMNLLNSWFDEIPFQFSVRENFSFFHTVTGQWKNEKLSLTLCWQNFRESNVFAKEVTK